MGKSSGSQPEAPDPRKVAGMEAQYNRIAELGPLGASYYSQGPDGLWARQMMFSKPVQNALDWQLYGVNSLMENALMNPLTMKDIEAGVSRRQSNPRKNALVSELVSGARKRWSV